MSEGKKYDQDKLKVELLYKDLVNELEDIAKVLSFGAKKYGSRNWQNLDNAQERYTAALIRHTNAFMKGELLDPESGLSHLAHAGCCILFLMFLTKDSSKPIIEYGISYNRDEIINLSDVYAEYRGND